MSWCLENVEPSLEKSSFLRFRSSSLRLAEEGAVENGLSYIGLGIDECFAPVADMSLKDSQVKVLSHSLLVVVVD
jgi:uncharacterized protein (DUF2461 family)